MRGKGGLNPFSKGEEGLLVQGKKFRGRGHSLFRREFVLAEVREGSLRGQWPGGKSRGVACGGGSLKSFIIYIARQA